MVDVDTVLDLLHKKRRRYALYYLDKQDEPVSIREVVKEVGKMEDDPDQIHISDNKFKEIEVEFHHNHFPKVESHEFIRYNSDENMIELTNKPPTLDTILTVAEVLEQPE